MTKYELNRQNMYEDLLGLGYFKDEDGTINFPFEDFNDAMSDPETASTLYENLIADGYYQDEDGNATVSVEEFVANLCDTRELLEFYPLTENQRGVYLDWEMNRETTQYNIPNVFHFSKMDVDVLVDALKATVNAHSYVKTRFVMRDGDVMQQRRDEESALVTVTNLDAQPDASFFQSRVRPFNPFDESLYRLEVYVWGEEVYLFKDFHHLVNDGLSETVFFQDLVKAVSGEELIDESFSAFDFAIYEQGLKNSERYAEAEGFFARMLEGVSSFKYPYSTELDNTSAKKDTLTCKISGSNAINALCQKLGITANSYFQTVATQVMHRLTREDCVVMATISNGRALPEMQDIIGMFVKTLPLAHTQQADYKKMKFADMAKTMHEQNVNTIERDFYPFTEIAQRYGVHPEILYAYQGGVVDGVTGGDDMGFETISVSLDTAKMPIELTFCPDEDGEYIVMLTYDTALYSHHDIDTLAHAMATYAANAAVGDVLLGDIKMLNEEEQKSQIVLGLGKKLDYDLQETWIDMFKRVVAATPDSVAVSDAERSLTYKELDSQSDVLANILLQNGVQPDAFVCTMMERTVFFAVTVLGLHKVAAAYTPLDMDYPNERLSYMVENSESKVLITTHADLQAKLAEGGLKVDHMQVIYLDEVDFTVSTEPICKAKPDNKAYMIYTSGSTGLPKGTMLHHRGLRNYIPSLIDFFGVTSQDKISHHRPFSFDAHLTDFYPPLAAGGELHIMPSAIRKNLEEMYHFIVDRKITGGSFTTSLGAMLLDNYKLPMRYVALSGEKMVGLVSDEVQLFNAYGPTECTDLICIHKLEKGRAYRDIPIGRPMANSVAVILDDTGNIVPEGVAGELCFVGPQVGYGYLKLQEKTDSVFFDVKDMSFFHVLQAAAPDVLHNASRLYHTGDLCRWNTEGVIECLGRIDNQIKLRGFRIELGEIETQAKEMPGVEKVVAQVREVVGVQHLILYYKQKEGCEVNEEEFRKFVEGTELAEYMRPEIYCCLEEFPYLPNGKVNKRMLPEPAMNMESIVLPETELEQQMFDMVKEVLKHDKFGVTTNLVSVGMTSLSAMRLVAAIAQNLDIHVKIADVMKNPTIRAIISGNDDAEEDALKVYDKRECYPLTENQRGVYLDWEMNRDTTQYNLPYLYRFATMDAQRLADAIRSVIEAHSYLKTRFVLEDGDVMQRRNDDEQVEILLQHVDKDPDMSFFKGRVRPFNVLEERLYRVEIYESPESTWLFWDIHHLIFDGLSTSLFMNEVMEAYNGADVEAETVTAFDVALYEQELMNGDAFQKAEARFDALVGDATAANYPQSDNIDEDKSKGNVVKAFIPKAVVDRFCSENGVTANSFLHAAFGEALSRLTNEDTPLYLTLSNGRSASVEMQKCMGMFVKTLPVVVRNSDKAAHLQQDVRDYVREVHAQLQESYEMDFYPYTRIVERHGHRSGVMFIYQGGLFEGGSIEGVEQIALPLDTIKFPVNMISYPDKDSYILSLEYDDARYQRKDMMVLVDAVANVAQSLATNNKVGDIRLLDADKEKEILNLSMGDQLEYDTDATWLSLFKAQVEKQPDALAVCDETSSLTYRQLDEESDRLAAYLIGQDVKPNDFVGISMNRCKEFVATILAIHKVGAAYLPLDPEYPKDRIDYMLEDSGASVIVDSDFYEAAQKAAGVFEGFLAAPETLAYIIYTSGSTGKPKGVLLHHRGLMNFTVATIGINGLTASDRISSHRSFSFDAHIEDVYPVLSAGASIHVMPDGIRKDLDAIYRFLVEHEITGGGYTTSIAKMLLGNYDLKQRYITCGGEALTGVVSNDVQIINVYGPTECTDHSAVYHMEKGREYKNIPIGRPMPNSSCFVVDYSGNLLPQGVAGELCYSGPQRGYGYLHLDDKTREVFSSLTVCGKEYEVYHTGDLARYNDEGLLECLGRIDNQVKLRGFRIETGEIEKVAMAYDGVALAVAHVKQLNGQPHLVLYYTSADGAVVDEGLRTYIEASSLAVYMHPEFYVCLDNVPRLPNGKVDYKSLPEPQLRHGEIVKPESQTEQKVYEAACEILKFDEFGVTDNLISLGLTSLLAMRLCVIVQQKCGKAIRMVDIMHEPYIRQIANLMDGEGNTTSIKHYELMADYPITENQRGIFFDWEKNHDTTQYNIPVLYKFNNIDVDRLAEALTKAVNAHAYIKTEFIINNGDARQLPQCEKPAEVTIKTLDAEPNIDFFQKRVRPFDLLKDVLYRIELYKYNGIVYLFMDKHHIICDGMSAGVFMRDVLTAYNGMSIADETITAYDFAMYEQELLSNVGADSPMMKAESYFDNLLDNATAMLYPESATTDAKDGDVTNLTTVVASAGIDQFCAANSVTANSYFQFAFAETMLRMTHSEKLMYLTVSNGRDVDTALQNSIGMFVKTLPVVCSMPKKGETHTVVNSVQAMQKQLQDTYSLDFYPYTRIVERNDVRAGAMFVYQGGLSEESGEIADVEQCSLELDTAKFPLTVMAFPCDEGYRINLEYDGAMYSRRDMQTLLDTIANVSVNMVNAQNTSDVALLSEESKAEVLAISTGKHIDVDITKTWVDAFLCQVKQTPDNVAVVDNWSCLTYSELDNASNALCHHLISEGVTPNQFVCVMLDRKKEFPLSVLAIHKAGAAYTPLDFEYPSERLSYMIENSQTKVLITTRDVLSAKLAEADMHIGDVKTIFVDELDLTQTTTPINLTTPDNLAYMIYTSGSTGKPKGAMLHHAGLWNFIHVVKDMENLTPLDRIEGHRSFSFDAHIEDMYAILTLGGSFHIMPSEIRKDPEAMYRFILDHQITGGGYSTAVAALMLNTYPEMPVRFITAGGEKLDGVYNDHIEIINVYGPTECTDDTSYYKVAPGERVVNIPIGKSVANTYNFIVDEYGHLLPQGVPGELCFAGIQVGRGYWQLPERTASVFCDCPFVDCDAYGRKVRMYHTGDLARYNSNGDLEFLGRIDTQVKLRGFRIELGEIESCALQFNGMKSVAAEVRKVNGAEHLVLYFTADAEINTESLSEFMSQSLTDYMVPTMYMQLETMPLTPNSKINRKALPEPTSQLQLENVAPANDMEQKMYDIAHELLPGCEFGVTDNLFLLGMTSLIAMKFAIRLKEIGIHATVASIVRYRNIRAVLHGNIRLAWQYHTYDPAKPVMVFVHGIVSSSLTMVRFEEWSEKFNIFVIEPIDAHYHILFEDDDYDTVVWLYKTQLDFLPEDADIRVFMGFSWGGKVAASMAEMYAEETGKKPLIILGDTAFNNPPVEHDMTVEDVTPEQIDAFRGLISPESLVDKFNIVFRMERTELPFMPYDGPVLHLNALKDGLTDRKKENMAIIDRLFPNVERVDFPDCDHDDMYMRQELNTKYSKLIYDKVEF